MIDKKSMSNSNLTKSSNIIYIPILIGDSYSTICISFDNSLKSVYQYSINSITHNARGEFNFIKHNSYRNNEKLIVLTIFVSDADYSAIKTNIPIYYESNPTLFDIAIDKSTSITKDLKIISIQIIKSIMSIIGKEQTTYISDDAKVFKVYEGDIDSYNSSDIDEIINKLNSTDDIVKENYSFSKQFRESVEVINKFYKPTPILEHKEFPVQFNSDGDMLIKNIKKIDFEKEYYNSVRLLKLYNKSKNMDGMKYEVSKLWFLNELITDKISSTADKDKKKVYTILRGKILNSFSSYLSIIVKTDKDFNFTSYYEESPFSSTKIKVNRSTIDFTLNAIKSMML